MSKVMKTKKKAAAGTSRTKSSHPVKAPSKKTRPPATAKSIKAAKSARTKTMTSAKAVGKASTSKPATRSGRKAAKVTVSKSPRSAPASKTARPIKVGKKLSRRKTFQAQIIVSAPAPPPEPPRRVVSTAAVRAFEHAVKVFHRRHYADAKKMFEEIAQHYSHEVEIAARTQTFLQICRQKLAHAQSVPRNADELYDRGVFALNTGDLTQARTFFEKSLRLKPDEPHVLYSLAATHAQSGASDLALDYLNRSIQIQPRFRSQALQDDDFSLLREDRRFIELTGIASPFDLLEARH